MTTKKSETVAGFAVTFERESLLAELQICAASVEGSKTLPILNNVLLAVTRAGANGVVRIGATDLDMTFQSSVRATVESKGAVTLEMRALLDIVKSLRGEEVSISADERGVRIESGTSKFKLPVMSAEDYPVLPEVAGDGVSIRLADLQRMLSTVSFAAAPEKIAISYGTPGVIIKTAKGRVDCYSTDGSQMAASTTKTDAEVEIETVIPRRAIAGILAFDGGEDPETAVDVILTADFLHVTLGGRTLTSRRVDAHYFDWRDLVKRWSPLPTKVTVERETLLDSLRRILIVQTKEVVSANVLCSFSKTRLTIRAEKSARGEAQDTIPAQMTAGENVVICVAGPKLVAYLEAMDCESVEFSLRDSDAATIIKPTTQEDANKHTYSLAPVRLSDSEKKAAA